MEELQQLYRERGSDLVGDLLNDYIIVTEKLSGSSFAFERHGTDIQFFKGTSQKPINLVDRTLMMYYEPAIAHINEVLFYGHVQLSPDFDRVPENWRFCFQYFVHNEPGIIKYTKLPKNNLVLTHIHVKGPNGKLAKVIDDPRVIRDWANTLDVTPLQPFFAGHLNDEQKAKIREFISIPVEDQEELFGTESFAEYLLQVLNPGITATTLHGSLKDPIDSLVFKFIRPGSGKTVSARVIDPYTKTLMKDKEPFDFRRAPADINEIILLDLLAFIEERGVKQSDVMSSTPEERYIELISALFNDYVKLHGDNLQGVKFDRADFSMAPEFALNLDMISNETTKKLVSGSESLADLYKIMLGSMRKKRDPERTGSIMTPSVVADFNALLDKINTIMHKEDSGKFKTFHEYLQMKTMNESLEDPLDDIIEERVEQVLSYKQFIDMGRVSLTEALTVPHKEQGKKKVNIIVGRFQPFTMGHAKVFKQIHDQNGHPVAVFTVRGKKPDPEKSPFSEELQQAMFAKMQREYPFLEAMYVAPSAAIDTLYSMLRPAYEPILWGYGTDRKKQYDFMINKPEYREQLGVDPAFTGYEIKRADEDISASKVREAIKLDDRKTFERMTPKSIHDMWETLQDVLTPVTESLIEESSNPVMSKKLFDSAAKDLIAFAKKKIKTGRTINTPSDLKSNKNKIGEHVRIPISNDLDTVTSELDELLRSAIGSDARFSYDIISPADYGSGAKSGTHYTIVATLTNGVAGHRAGDQLIFVNQAGVAGGVLRRKQLTPYALGFPSDTDMNQNQLVAATKKALLGIKSQNMDIWELLDSLVDSVSSYRSSFRFANPSEITNLNDVIPLSGETAQTMTEINPVDVNIIGNDFGEILGAIYMSNLVGFEKGISFPKGNEPLMDFSIDGYGISSKHKKGAAPTLTNITRGIKPDQLTNEQQTKLFEVLKIAEENPVAMGYLLVAEHLMMPGYVKLKELMKDYSMDVDGINSFIKDNAGSTSDGQFESKAMSLLDDFYNVIKSRPSLPLVLEKLPESKYYGLVIGPLSKHVKDFLNGKVTSSASYTEPLKEMLSKLDVKQLYMSTSISKNSTSIIFTISPFSDPNNEFEFENPNQSVYTASNGKLGFRLMR